MDAVAALPSMSVPILGIPGLRVGSHVDVFKRDPDTGEQTLVSTTRPCPGCGEPLVGLVAVDRAGRQECANCRGLESL